MAPPQTPQGYESEMHGVLTTKGEQMGLLLPPHLSQKIACDAQGWKGETLIKVSGIPAAGNGRYANEPICEGKECVRKHILPMSKVTSFADTVNNHKDGTITFSNKEQLEKYIELAIKEGGYTRKQVLTTFAHFIYGFDGQVVCLNVCTWTVNHGESPTSIIPRNVKVIKKTEDGVAYLVGIANMDIKVGDEFGMDYRAFRIPQWYVDWYTQLNKENPSELFVDVRCATLMAVYEEAYSPAEQLKGASKVQGLFSEYSWDIQQPCAMDNSIFLKSRLGW